MVWLKLSKSLQIPVNAHECTVQKVQLMSVVKGSGLGCGVWLGHGQMVMLGGVAWRTPGGVACFCRAVKKSVALFWGGGV